ncbi:hypothetical protein A0O28_0093690 [Trichoderma guizhouense]|uniref:Uncharacterized protein n=1 Tax=Trichoderma guizhouense TaxID=1491466 RepID=A0A1T3CXI8_9HYPO|nr:hypothetical protein A0O28_0093690 [Trichoderma guizhouense]
MSDQTNLWLYREPNPSHMHLSTSHSDSDEKQLPQEPDYDKYVAMMELWSKIHPKAHLSWREGLETARQLQAGERSVSVLRRLVTKAMREEVTDVEFVRYKFRTASDRHPIMQDDVSRLIPLALGRLMGMGSPDDADEQALRCPGLWDVHFVPRTIFRPDLRLAVEYADEIMQLLKTAQMRDPLELATMEQKATKWLTKLVGCLRDATHVEWLRNWTRRFPEVSGHGDDPDGQSLPFTPGVEPFIPHITHQQSLSTGEEMPALDHVAQTVIGQSTVPHSETAVPTCSVEAMLGSVHLASEHDNNQIRNVMEPSNDQTPASNDQTPDAEGQTSKSIEQPSNPSSLMDAAEAAIANGPMLDYPLRVYDWRTPAKSTPPVRGNDDGPASNDETPSSEGVGGEATGNAWPPERIIAFIDDLSKHARISARMIARIVDLEDGWYIQGYWPSAQEVASLVREIADKHRRPIPPDLANGLADWEEHGMNV